MGKSSENTRKGRWAETYVAEYLEKEGWTILQKNACFVGGELDLIAKDPKGILVFLEVKSSWKEGHGRPTAQVHRNKQNHLWKAALRWISQNQIADQQMRFDVIGIRWIEGQIQLEHLQNAFDGPSSTW